jgi:hypothetical protein
MASMPLLATCVQSVPFTHTHTHTHQHTHAHTRVSVPDGRTCACGNMYTSEQRVYKAVVLICLACPKETDFVC